ncbi:hypothetical protein DNTS_006291 [Danionella cerebrum]|uniref:Glycosyl hydrolase family 13 catalytic domain-containing protein n=1 Tax=Danionella cerebrum TaxID=2873325 RepID=A0A553Q206_9TELE|nr:hypothetical protein DNTS_006291 [Danionella translucida]
MQKMTLKVDGDPAHGSVSVQVGRYPDLNYSNSETAPLLVPECHHDHRFHRHQQQAHWRPLNREELEIIAGGPRWRKLRSRLLLCFWFCWLLMLGTAVAIIIQTPKAVTPDLRWWQKDVFYHLHPGLLMDVQTNETSHISRVSARLPYLKSLGVSALILQGMFGPDSSSANLTEIDHSLGTLPQFTQLITQSRNAGVRVILDLCELDLFDQELGNVTDVWSSMTKNIQYTLRFWLVQGVSGFGICDTDPAFSKKTLMEWNMLLQEFSSHDDERILMVRQLGNIPSDNVFNISVNGSLVELFTKPLIPDPHHPLSPAEVAEAMEASLQTQQRDWPSWTVGGGVPRELHRAILVLIMTLPGTPIIKYGEEFNLVQQVTQLNQPPALFHSLSQSRAHEEALHFGTFTLLTFNASLPSSGLNSTSTPPIAFLRSWGCVHFLVLIHLGSKPHSLDPGWAPSLPEGGVFVTSTGLDRFGPVTLRSIKMQPHEAIVIKLFESDITT